MRKRRGQDDLPVVQGDDLGADNVDTLDSTGEALGLNVVAGLEGLERQEHEAAGEVLDRAAHGHADGHAARSQECGQRGGVDAQRADHEHDQDDPQDHCDEALHEAGQGGVGPATGKGPGDEMFGLADEPGADDVQDQRENELDAELDTGGDHLLDQFLGGGVPEDFGDLGAFGMERVRTEALGDLLGLRGDGLEDIQEHTFLQVDEEPGHIGGPDEEEQGTVHPVDLVLLADEQGRHEGKGAHQQDTEVHVGDVLEGQGMDEGRSAQDKEDVEKIRADDVAQRELSLLLDGGRHTGGQLRHGSAAGQEGDGDE